MLFNSYTFFLFFLVVLSLARAMGNWTLRKSFLLFCSYAFYAAWNPPFVLLLWISTGVDWFASRWIHASRSGRSRRAFLLLSLCANLGLLFYFKYGGFLVGNANQVMDWFGLSWRLGQLDVILPVGISFYTFQTMSYSLDVYYGRMKPWDSFLDFALYVTFFPQLVAGPIVRAAEFLPQCRESRRATSGQLGWGMFMFILGIFAKVTVADALMAPVVDSVFGAPGQNGFVSAWVGTVAFAMQIFYDFFGYSTAAIGIALCLGFDLPDNFRFPYASLGFSDFWRRWHISLSSWLRDYLYIPLGGNRKGRVRTHVNLMLTMLLGGLWHGASWMFLIWGGLHGLYLIVERRLSVSRISRLAVWETRPGRAVLVLATFALVCVAWVYFRAQDLQSAVAINLAMLNPGNLIGRLFGAAPPGVNGDLVWIGKMNFSVVAGVGLATLVMHYRLRNSSVEQAVGRWHPAVRAGVLAAMIYLAFISMTGADNAFIYFQF